MGLKDYIQGGRRGKDANRLEREAMSDPFLQDAMDGFDAVAGNHAQIIEQLEKKYTGATFVETGHAPSLRRTRMFYWSAAASVLILVGFSVFFFLDNPEKTMPAIAMLQSNETEQEIVNLSSEPEPVPIEESQQKIAIAEEKMSKSISTLTRPLTPHELSLLSTSHDVDVSDISVEKSPSTTSELDEVMDVSIVTDEVAVNAIVTEDIVTEKRASERIVASPAKATARKEQGRQTVRGKVIDETGEPLPGASITVKGTNTGTVTDIEGNFSLQVATDAPKLIASFVGFESQEVKPSDEEPTIVLKESVAALDEVVVVGYGTQRKSNITGAAASKIAAAPTITFGEKEFQDYCQQNGDKNICNGKGASVRVTFYIDETGKPAKIEFKNFSCEEAKKEMENLFSTSPAWTKTNRKVTMTIKW